MTTPLTPLLPLPAAPVRVEVWSDVACPWCFIGKRRFERGVALAGVPVEVTYRSFELSPDTPVDFAGTSVDFLAHRKGMPEAQVRQMLDHVTALAAAEGLDYDFDAVRHTNTRRAHALLHLARLRGRQLDLVERLFAAYFEQGRHLGRDDELVELATEAGLDADEARDALATGRFDADVDADVAQARAYGITGVPFFVLEGRYGVSGAQPAETFAEVLAQVAAERPAPVAEGDACGVDGC